MCMQQNKQFLLFLSSALSFFFKFVSCFSSTNHNELVHIEGRVVLHWRRVPALACKKECDHYERLKPSEVARTEGSSGNLRGGTEM